MLLSSREASRSIVVSCHPHAASIAPITRSASRGRRMVSGADVASGYKGEIVNAITATGTDPSDKDTPGKDEVTVPTEEPNPELTVINI